MTALIIVFKAGLISGFVSLVGWVAVYTRLAKGWHDEIGRTLVVKTLLIAALMVPSALSLFLHLSRMDSLVAGWIDAGLIWLITPVMLWRTAVWIRNSKPRDLTGGA